MTIDEEAMRAAYAELRDRVRFLEAILTSLGLLVSDDALDQPKGDPKVRFMPRDWRGEDFTGKTYSECSPDFLERMASTLQWTADNPPRDPAQLEKHQRFERSNRLDAARARSWSRRLRAVAASKRADSRPPPPTAPMEDPFADVQSHANGIENIDPFDDGPTSEWDA